jgi:hypothetical protein
MSRSGSKEFSRIHPKAIFNINLDLTVHHCPPDGIWLLNVASLHEILLLGVIHPEEAWAPA